MQGSSFATGLEVSDKRKRVLILSTGSKNVDGILGGRFAPLRCMQAHFVVGGIMSQSISEGGSSGNSETTVAHQRLL
jgi:RecA/RadA recombinase